MSEEQEYIGFIESPPDEEEEPEKPKPKITFDELVKDSRRVKRRLRPSVYAIFHFFLAFGAGSVVNYLVAEGYIKPSHVTQIIVVMLSFIFLRLNTLIGDKK